jgi:hypothetical protein
MQYRFRLKGVVIRCVILLSAVFGSSVCLVEHSSLRAEEILAEVQLSPNQTQLLMALGLRVAVPTYVPRGFTLEKVSAEIDQQSRIGGIGYTIIYRRYDSNTNQDFCFAIQATNGGIGDLPDGSQSYPINSPSFGKSSLEYGNYGQTSSPTYLSNWLGGESGPFYRFVGAGVIPGLSPCRNLSVQEAIRVTESIQYMN